MMYRPARRLCGAMLFYCVLALGSSAFAQTEGVTYRGTLPIVRYDISPPLKDIPPIPPDFVSDMGGLMVDPSGVEGDPKYGPQSRDEVVQQKAPGQEIPDPVVNFDSLSNISGVAPPDPVGDIGPNHYVAMSNLSFEIYTRTGMSVFGPALNNTLWSGFGGPCQTQNAGDPIVLHDQFVDRWILTQFTSSPEGGTGNYYNCVAVSTTADPTGSYHRYQISNGTLFPDYPKYGVGEDAYYISTRDFSTPYVGVGAYALNKQHLISGAFGANTVIAFFVDRSIPQNVGDGILPMDIDGDTLPPANSPHYYFGTMDDGGPYGAPEDSMTVWAFDVDFVTPANSSFTLLGTVPFSPYDTIFPCTGPQGRSCIPQPDTSNGLDHQGYRQRPLHRAAYRNYGTHQSLVTLQSVEAAPNISGMRWWEMRINSDEGTDGWHLYQEGTYAPGVNDHVHRWFGSIAMDSAGNVALGYSAANEDTYPSIWYSGQLFVDAHGTMNQGEGEIVEGTGSQTAGGSRWGDYSSMNVDPVDDCTFWYVNEYVPTTSASGWRLRVGAFSFDECGEPGFALGVVSDIEASVCTGDDATFDLNIGSVEDFDMPVSLAAMGHPAGTTAMFVPNPVDPIPNTSTLTIGNTAGATPGEYDIEITGTATGVDSRIADVELTVFDAVPATPTLLLPADLATGVPVLPTFEWTEPLTAEGFLLEVATDEAFSNIIWSLETVDGEATPTTPFDSGTTYYWRVRAANACGESIESSVFSFTTVSLPGDCPAGNTRVVAYNFDFEDGAQGWTSSSTAGPNTWELSATNPLSGSQHWHALDVAEVSDQRLTSPILTIPAGLTNLTFRFFNYQDMEANPPGCYDAGILEVSTNGGTSFTQVGNPDLLTDPYNGTINAGFSNPLGGLQGWCGSPQPYTDSRVDISGLAGTSDVVFRFRMGTDSGVGAPGWDIDDVKVVGCSNILEFESGFENTLP